MARACVLKAAFSDATTLQPRKILLTCKTATSTKSDEVIGHFCPLSRSRGPAYSCANSQSDPIIIRSSVRTNTRGSWRRDISCFVASSIDELDTLAGEFSKTFLSGGSCESLKLHPEGAPIRNILHAAAACFCSLFTTSPPPVEDVKGAASHSRSNAEPSSSTLPAYSLRTNVQSRGTHGSEKQRVFITPLPDETRAVEQYSRRAKNRAANEHQFKKYTNNGVIPHRVCMERGPRPGKRGVLYSHER